MSSKVTVWTIKELLIATAEYFSKKQIVDTPQEARLEAELLLAHVLQCKRIDLLVRYEEVPTEPERASYRELVRRRAERWPTAYLIGTREFFLHRFEVSPAVLIPRPDTETLVLKSMDLAKSMASPRILDIGTGSGCIALCLAHAAPKAKVTAVDISPDALQMAAKNARTLGLESRVQFLQSDLFAGITGETFDLIVSNPPYIATGEMATLDPEVKDHEPRVALDGGPDGLAFYRRILNDASRFLTSEGWLLFEVGATQAAAVQALMEASADLEYRQTHSDRGGIARVVTARKRK